MYWVRCVHSTYKSINLPMQKLMCGILPSRQLRIAKRFLMRLDNCFLPSRQMERHSARRYL